MPRKAKQQGRQLYCLKCKKHTSTLNAEHVQKNGRHMIQGKCGTCGMKKTMFVKAHEAAGLLSGLLGFKDGFPGLNQIPVIGALL
jgi:hypothetical protein